MTGPRHLHKLDFASTHTRLTGEPTPCTDVPDVENLVPELVPISAHLTVPGRTEAGPKPRFSPQMDLS
jgi:hypothetical protein